MTVQEVIALGLMLAGCAFYLAGTIGLLRFPDVFCRLHALTKADNLGLFLICLGLGVLSGDGLVISLLMLIWLVGLLAATVSAHLIARQAHERAESDPDTGTET